MARQAVKRSKPNLNEWQLRILSFDSESSLLFKFVSLQALLHPGWPASLSTIRPVHSLMVGAHGVRLPRLIFTVVVRYILIFLEARTAIRVSTGHSLLASKVCALF
jgi:hypothetical protein